MSQERDDYMRAQEAHIDMISQRTTSPREAAAKIRRDIEAREKSDRAAAARFLGVDLAALDKVRELVEAWKVWHTTSERGSALRFDAHDSVFSKAAALGALLAKEPT